MQTEQLETLMEIFMGMTSLPHEIFKNATKPSFYSSLALSFR